MDEMTLTINEACCLKCGTPRSHGCSHLQPDAARKCLSCGNSPPECVCRPNPVAPTRKEPTVTTPTSNSSGLLMPSPTLNSGCKCETEEVEVGEGTRDDDRPEPGTIANALRLINNTDKGTPLPPSPEVDLSGDEPDGTAEDVYE